MIYEVAGDILLSKAELIVHGVAPNDHFEQGLALSLREKFPAMYQNFRHNYHVRHPDCGGIAVWSGEGVHIAHLFTQDKAPDRAGGHADRLEHPFRGVRWRRSVRSAYVVNVPAGGSSVVRLRLSAASHIEPFGDNFDVIFAARLADADEFYNRITPPSLSEDERRVHRQALAGMLWGKQYYFYDLDTWLKEHDAHPLVGTAKRTSRNAEWFHMFKGDIISMPDKWEYPWYAAWDLAFHTISLSLVDFDFAKEQLLMMLRSLYAHPNDQIPAYEWNFSDVNPPVHAWATLYLFKVERNL